MLASKVKQTFSLTPIRGEGSYLYDKDDYRYLDLTSGIGVLNLGHSHPRVVAAIVDQAKQIQHAQFVTVRNHVLDEFCEQVLEVLPGDLNSIFPTNSGSETIDAALRIARQVTRRPNVIHFEGSFHGRTLGAASVCGLSNKAKTHIQPLPAGTYVAGFPGFNGVTTESAIDRFEYLLKTQTHKDDLAAVIIEPIQGENGFHYAGAEFLQYLQKRCDELGALLITDEVQSGYGRSGHFWAHQSSGITPDMIVAGKAAGGGLPFGYLAMADYLIDRVPD